MKKLFDEVSFKTSKEVTRTYSTSFSLGILCLSKKIHNPIYGIYGFVRLADEIVDSFHEFNKAELFNEFKRDTFSSIEMGFSLNPILNAFQQIVKEYSIDEELIHSFLNSMEADLHKKEYDAEAYSKYIFGSAEAVGLMCLKVFTERDSKLYNQLKYSAMKLGYAFKKINFLRDLKQDYYDLGRFYFPGINIKSFNEKAKKDIELDISSEFKIALEGIKKLPRSSRFGVYVAYIYYRALFEKIKALPSVSIMNERVRIPNYQKIYLLVSSYFRHSFQVL